MAKAIHWPGNFRDEILAEDCERLFCAFRLGTVYFDGRYWCENETVDIRCNQLRLRRAVVVGDLKACAIQDLSPEDYARQKSSLQTQDQVIAFLTQTYHQPVTPDTVVTVVTYRNEPVIADAVETLDDPSKRYL